MNPILQFGTSRFLQAHVDLFVSEALAQGQALGRITVVQTTGSPARTGRVDAFNDAARDGFPVRVRGLSSGQPVDFEQRVTSVGTAVHADAQWSWLRQQVAGPVQVIVSNTGDQGYALHVDDHAGLLDGAQAPRSFPAKLLVLLHARYRSGGAPLSLLPCELVSRNGDVLRDTVTGLALDWGLDDGFLAYLAQGCVWANALVDRIVSEPIEPVGAVAEPYALWAIESQPGLTLPCSHPAIVLTGDLGPFERRKLYLLNLGHTWLADQWLRQQGPADATVAEAMRDPALRGGLEQLWEDEVLPVFEALGEGDAARAYVADVRDRFSNPWLAHRLADIAQNHGEKKRRRLQPVLELAQQRGLGLEQARLRAAMAGG
jgi:tagaturonate reductase